MSDLISPTLRFPQYVDSYKGYQTIEFLVRYKQPVALSNDQDYIEIGIRSWGKGIFHKPSKLAEEIGGKRVFWLDKDLLVLNIVFAWEQAVARTTEAEVGKIASHRFPMFKVKASRAVLSYLVFKFLTPRGKYLLELASPGGAGRNKTLGQKEFDRLKLHLPSTMEQQKVADFLTAVDSKISQLTEKHRLLKEYKKGVMQQLFSQQLRFKDYCGKAFPDWEEFRLDEIVDPIKRKADRVVENVMTISAGKGFLHQKERFSQVIAGTSLDKYTHLKKGEFAYNRGNSKSYTYGCIYKLEDAEALIPFVYRSFKLKVGVAEFYAQLFAMKYLDRQLRRLISSSARMDGLLNIGEKNFYQVTVPFPSEKEQQKIAQFLQSIDSKIDAVTKQIEQTKQFKKGLLQQMFV